MVSISSTSGIHPVLPISPEPTPAKSSPPPLVAFPARSAEQAPRPDAPPERPRASSTQLARFSAIDYESSLSKPLSKIIQHLLPCQYQAGEKLADDFHIVTFMTAHNEEMKIVGKSKEGDFLATDPKTGKILAKLKRIAVYSSDQALQAGEPSRIAWMEPQNVGLNGGAKTYSALYHETQGQYLNDVNTHGIYPRNTTGTEGIGLMNSEEGVYLYAHHKTQQPGIGEPVALFASNIREWNSDPWSPGMRTQTPTVPARNYQGGKAAISVTAPLTPRTVQGMDYFHSSATGTTKPAGQGAQELLNEFHRKFPGTSFPATIS